MGDAVGDRELPVIVGGLLVFIPSIKVFLNIFLSYSVLRMIKTGSIYQCGGCYPI